MKMHAADGHAASELSHSFFFFNDTATTEIYTLSLHDALPISRGDHVLGIRPRPRKGERRDPRERSEEHTSELQSLAYSVCRLLLDKKKKIEACSVQYTKRNRTLEKEAGINTAW